MVIDIWERLEEGDLVIGCVRISLYQFYITYRNAVVTQNYIANKVLVFSSNNYSGSSFVRQTFPSVSVTGNNY